MDLIQGDGAQHPDGRPSRSCRRWPPHNWVHMRTLAQVRPLASQRVHEAAKQRAVQAVPPHTTTALH